MDVHDLGSEVEVDGSECDEVQTQKTDLRGDREDLTSKNQRSKNNPAVLSTRALHKKMRVKEVGSAIRVR